MNMDRLHTFVDVYRAGSFAAVARQRNEDPSIISRAISNLERNLDARLFIRTTRRMTPTDEARRLFKRTEPLLQDLTNALEEVHDCRQLPSGLLRVSASVSYGTAYLIPNLSRFSQRFPNIRVDLRLSDRRIDLFEEQIDVAIRHGHLQDSSLIAKRLRDVQYHLVCSHNYAQKHTLPTHPSELRKHSLLTFSYEAFSTKWAFQKRLDAMSEACQEDIIIDPRLALSNALALREAAINGLGIALLPNWILDNSDLKYVLKDWNFVGSADTSLWVVRPSRDYVPQRVKLWLDYLDEINGIRSMAA